MDLDDFIKLLDNSDSFSDVMRKYGFSPINGSSKTLKNAIIGRGLSYTNYKEKYKKIFAEKQRRINAGRTRELPTILVKDSTYSRHYLKKRLLKENILKNICYECGIESEWNGKYLSLQIDHINGINNDNRIENLRILCPNCHSQTKTYAGKNNEEEPNKTDRKKPKIKPKIKQKKRTYICENCKGIKKTKKAKVCDSCRKKDPSKKSFDITKEKLYDLIWVKKLPFTTIGKMYNVSDNAIRKRCKTLGIPERRRSPKHID